MQMNMENKFHSIIWFVGVLLEHFLIAKLSNSLLYLLWYISE